MKLEKDKIKKNKTEEPSINSGGKPGRTKGSSPNMSGRPKRGPQRFWT